MTHIVACKSAYANHRQFVNCPIQPRDMYLKLSSQKRSPDPNLVEHPWIQRSYNTFKGAAFSVFFFFFSCVGSLERSFSPYSCEKNPPIDKRLPTYENSCLRFYLFWRSLFSLLWVYHERCMPLSVAWCWELKITLSNASPALDNENVSPFTEVYSTRKSNFSVSLESNVFILFNFF